MVKDIEEGQPSKIHIAGSVEKSPRDIPAIVLWTWLVTIGAIALFLVLGLLCLIQFCLVWTAYNKANSIDNYIVSPFDSIQEEFAPNSTYPCVYPVFSYPYENTYKCNCKLKKLKFIL